VTNTGNQKGVQNVSQCCVVATGLKSNGIFNGKFILKFSAKCDVER